MCSSDLPDESRHDPKAGLGTRLRGAKKSHFRHHWGSRNRNGAHRAPDVTDLVFAHSRHTAHQQYLRAVRQLAAYYMVSPDRLSERKVEQYLLYVRDELGVANRCNALIQPSRTPATTRRTARHAPTAEASGPDSWPNTPAAAGRSLATPLT